MPKILFIAAHRLDRNPSQRYRFEQYLSFFEANGFSCELSNIISEKDDNVFYNTGNLLKKAGIVWKGISIRLNDVRRANDFDIIFIDSTERNHSTVQDGAKVFPLRRNETEAAFLVHFHDSGESQIFSFFKEKSGEARFSILASKGGPSIYKSSVMVGDCTPIDFKLINEGDGQ